MTTRPFCRCLEPSEKRGGPRELRLHTEGPAQSSDAWKRLLDLIEQAADDGREVFAPGRDLGADDWWQITTLPPSIARLKAVKQFDLYGSGLVRIPPEIGAMDALENFDPYTSYRLHWFPFEITRCRHLKDSRVSTRALYGNYKYRAPFPRLPQAIHEFAPAICSVCSGPFGTSEPLQRWISLRVATDVLPLLVHACSVACVERLPAPPAGYVSGPHQGGRELAQPPPR